MLRCKVSFAAVLLAIVAAVLPPGAAAARLPAAVAARLPRAAGARPLRAAGPAVLLSSSASGLAFRLDVPWQSLAIERVAAGGREFVRVSIPGWDTTGEAGDPALPAFGQAIGAPFGAELSVQVARGPAHTSRLPAPVLPVETTRASWDPEAAAAPVAAPSAAPSAALPAASHTVEARAAAYSRDAPTPGALARIASDGVLREQRVAGIVAYPVQFRPAANELTVYEWLRVEVSFDGGSPAAASSGKRAAMESDAYEDFFRRELLNYQGARQLRRAGARDGNASATEMDRRGGSAREAASVGEAASAGAPTGWAPPVPGWRVKVRANGMVRLAYDDLLAAGLSVDTLDPRTLQLYCLGREAAIYVSGEADGRLEPGDYLLFYGQAAGSKYAPDGVYWLTYGRQPGLRVAARDGAPGESAEPAYYRATRRLEANLMYLSKAPGDEALDRWLWDYVYPPDKPGWSQPFFLADLYGGDTSATLRIALLGGMDEPSSPDHHAIVSVNGAAVADARWDGLAWRVVEIEFPQSLLAAGSNTISVACPNDTKSGVDLVYVDWAELEYARAFQAEGDELAFDSEASGTWRYRLDGFSGEDVTVFDITDPAAPVRIGGIEATASGPAHSAAFEDPAGGPRTYWAGTERAYRGALAIEPDTASDLSAPANAADYLVITHGDFAAEAERLAGFRAGQGLRARVVDIQDVYDEFGYGMMAPAAVHDFLAYAYAHWQAPAPSFVVLLGDGHYDPRDYLGYGRPEYVPPYLAPVDPWIGETAADNRYVTLAGEDGLPEMMIGRLPANSRAEASALVEKIIQYESNPPPGEWQGQVLAVADNADSGGSFAATTEDLVAHHLPAPFGAEKVYYGVTHATAASARSAIRAGIGAGKLIVNYAGHAAVTAWAAEGLFKAADVPLLQNGPRLPVVLAMTCYDGYFHYPYPYSIGAEATSEVMVRAPGGGAVASWSPSGLGTEGGHVSLDRGFFDAVFRDGAHSLGEAAHSLGEASVAAKLDLWATGANLDLLDTYLLFGDPATRLPLAPASAPVAPQITVERVPGMPQVKLSWLNQQEDPFYEVWRGTTPYFEPAGDPRGQVAYLYGEPYGVMGLVPFTDDGQDGYSSGPGDPLLEPVQVTGDAGANYFWVVRGRSGQSVSENSNRAGEFDYPLVGGGAARR